MDEEPGLRWHDALGSSLPMLLWLLQGRAPAGGGGGGVRHYGTPKPAGHHNGQGEATAVAFSTRETV